MEHNQQKQLTNFLDRLPLDNKLTPTATIALQFGALASELSNINRTRTIHPDGRPENVAEHSLMLAIVAPELADLLYPTLDANLVARFSTLHDDPEAYVGDTPTDTLANLDLTTKEVLEEQGVNQLIKDFAMNSNFIRLIRQYKEQSVPEARFVRAVDKIMVLLIHIPNDGAVLKANYTYESFLESERILIERDGYKYGEFDKIKELRQELGLVLANRYLKLAS